MPDYSQITVFILAPLIFRYHLPLKIAKSDKNMHKYGILESNELIDIRYRFPTWYHFLNEMTAFSDWLDISVSVFIAFCQVSRSVWIRIYLLDSDQDVKKLHLNLKQVSFLISAKMFFYTGTYFDFCLRRTLE